MSRKIFQFFWILKIYFPNHCISITVVESIKSNSKQTNSDELFKVNFHDLSSTCDESECNLLLISLLYLFLENIDVQNK